MALLDPLFSAPAVDQILADDARIQRMLDFEAALAGAEAAVEIIPLTAAQSIADCCRADRFDCEALAASAVAAGNLAIPLINQLRAVVAAAEPEAARYVHWGATSQDVIDTGLVLQLRDALGIVSGNVENLVHSLARQVVEHRFTILVGRTWMQHAAPTTLGLQMAGWLDALVRHQRRLAEVRKQMTVLQFGGAAGTLAALGDRGPAVSRELARRLQLSEPALPWHTHRDRLAAMATTLGLLTGTLGKIARDISLLMQTEIAELSEPSGEGRGGSSTMPHKRNPVTCAVVLAAATRVPPLVSTMLSSMVQEEERGLGGWQAEWETLPEIVRLSAGALHHLLAVVPRLEIDAVRMKENLDRTRGLIFAEAVSMALAREMGREKAHRLLEEASRKSTAKQRHLLDILQEEEEVTARISSAMLASLFDPTKYLGASDGFVQRVLDGIDSKAYDGQEER